MGFKVPGIEFPELPDCTGLIAAGERLMTAVADELPRLVDAVDRIADAYCANRYGNADGTGGFEDVKF